MQVIPLLYAASTEKMAARILGQSPEIAVLVDSLRGDDVAIAELLNEAVGVAKQDWDPHTLHPDEMVLLAALFVLSRLAKGSAQILLESILAHAHPALTWTNRFAVWLAPHLSASDSILSSVGQPRPSFDDPLSSQAVVFEDNRVVPPVPLDDFVYPQ